MLEMYMLLVEDLYIRLIKFLYVEINRVHKLNAIEFMFRQNWCQVTSTKKILYLV